MGWGPQHKEMQQAFPRTTQVGVGPQQKDLSKRKSTNNASWGG
ncbi:hypothetical protein [Staphylococcus lugdunensis]|nr:hypothetical protein [Staphylococcus lugdunensis]MDK7914010.1 hypothetical protein [Staphylococcus lugdunensis]MDU7611265.1 hypothetical protein [Staphylococcus lugdunensis]